MLLRIIAIGLLCILGYRFSFIVDIYRLKYNEKIIYEEPNKPDTVIYIRKTSIANSDTISFLYSPDNLISDSFDVKLYLVYQNKSLLVVKQKCIYEGFAKFRAKQLLDFAKTYRTNDFDLRVQMLDSFSFKLTSFSLK